MMVSADGPGRRALGAIGSGGGHDGPAHGPRGRYGGGGAGCRAGGRGAGGFRRLIRGDARIDAGCAAARPRFASRVRRRVVVHHRPADRRPGRAVLLLRHRVVGRGGARGPDQRRRPAERSHRRRPRVRQPDPAAPAYDDDPGSGLRGVVASAGSSRGVVDLRIRNRRSGVAAGAGSGTTGRLGCVWFPSSPTSCTGRTESSGRVRLRPPTTRRRAWR